MKDLVPGRAHPYQTLMVTCHCEAGASSAQTDLWLPRALGDGEGCVGDGIGFI